MGPKQQIIHIHGGSSFNSYQQYIENLKLWNFTLNDAQTLRRWSKNYEFFLNTDSFQIISPTMPSKHNAKYIEWKIWFEKIFEYMSDDVILVGHSLGGTFIAKYLAENSFPVQIKQLHLVAPVFDYEDDEEQLADFKLEEFPGVFFENKINEIHLYHSTDDVVVPISESEKYHVAIPDANFHTFINRGHFLDESFPELFNNIQKGTK